jgi:Flp pilus assembly protein TadD
MAQLAEIDALLAREPDHVELRYLRAGLLTQAGRTDEARDAYLAVLARQPSHFGALNDLGTLLYGAGFRTAARTAYAEAIRHHPDNPIARINLANALLADGEADEARLHYEAALITAPDHPDAHQGLANLLQDAGEAEAAEAHRQQSYRARTITTLPYHGDRPPCRMLLLVSAAGGNVPTQGLLDPARFAVSVLVVEAHTPETVLPPHDLVFNAIGDADLCAAALDAAEAVLARTDAPVVNPPARVRPTGRAAIASSLSGLPGVRTPKVVLVPREAVAEAATGFAWPLLVRSPGYHTGRHFVKVEHGNMLDDAIAALPGHELLLIEWLDARDARGLSLKFRVMTIGGRLYPLHLALSRDWKVHYFTADMAEAPDHRAEDAAFLADMADVLGSKAVAGLEAIAGALGLDYAGIDFGLSSDGEVLLFEANATMVVNPPDADPRWDYRRAPTQAILDAARAMLLTRARPQPS